MDRELKEVKERYKMLEEKYGLQETNIKQLQDDLDVAQEKLSKSKATNKSIKRKLSIKENQPPKSVEVVSETKAPQESRTASLNKQPSASLMID